MTDKMIKNKDAADIESNGEIDLSKLFTAIWNTRSLVISTVVLSALLLAGLLAFMRAAIPTQQIFQQAVKFTFQGVEKKEYPNGSDFSLSDVIAPLILNDVYKKNALSKQGIKLRTFTSSISVHPYSPAYEAVFSRYRARLADKKLQFVERQEIEKDMQGELEKLRGKNALLQIRLEKRLGISEKLGRKLLHDIASTWATLSIEQLGVLKLPEGFENKELVDISQLNSMSENGAINLLMDAVGRCKIQIAILDSFGGGQTIVDTQSGHTISSLMRNLEIFELYPDGLETGSRLIQKYHEQRIKALELDKVSVDKTAEMLRVGLESYTKSTPAGANSISQGSGKPVLARPQGSSVMQLDDAFIGKIISLAQLSVDQEYRTKLLGEYISLKKKSIEIDKNVESLKIILESSVNDRTAPNIDALPSGGSDTESKKKAVRHSAKKLNELWKIAGRLFEQLSTERVSFNKRLYVNLDLPSSQYASTYHPLINKKTAWVYFSALFAIGVFATIAGVLWQALRPQPKT